MNSDTRLHSLEMTVAQLSAGGKRRGWRSRWAAIGAAIAVTFGGGTALHYAWAAPGDVVQSSFVPISPVRILDTRPAPENVGGFVGPLAADQIHTFQVTGVAGVPANASAVVMNVTVVGTSSASFLTVYPTGSTRPLVSNLNWAAGDTAPNLVNVKIGAGGQVTVYNHVGNTNVIADIAGYYVPGNDKFLSLPVRGVGGDAAFQEGFGTNAGMVFRDASSDTIAYNVVLPPDYTPGTALVATFTWHTTATACNVNWTANYVSVSRAGLIHPIGASATTGMSNPGATAAGAVTKVVHSTAITLNSPSASFTLQPGDSYTFGMFRDGVTDTCGGDTLIDSMSIRYE